MSLSYGPRLSVSSLGIPSSLAFVEKHCLCFFVKKQLHVRVWLSGLCPSLLLHLPLYGKALPSQWRQLSSNCSHRLCYFSTPALTLVSLQVLCLFPPGTFKIFLLHWLWVIWLGWVLVWLSSFLVVGFVALLGSVVLYCLVLILPRFLVSAVSSVFRFCLFLSQQWSWSVCPRSQPALL